MWRRQQPYWHAVFAIVWAAAVVVTLIDDPGPHGRAPSLALLGVIALAYAVLGTRGMTNRDVRWAVAYQVVAWTALLGIQWVDPSTQAWLLYFALFPQLWAMLPTRWAVVGTVVVVTAFSVVRWAQLGFSADSLTEILISSVISMGLSLSLGLFINRIVGEAESRAETIDELRATQARLAAAERDRGVHEERERISREIHDTLAQGFTSVVALSRAAQAALGPWRHHDGGRAARAHRAHGIRQPRRSAADRRRAHARAPAVAHPRRGPRAAGGGGDERDRAARRRAGGRRPGAARRVGRGRHPAHRPGGAVERAAARVGRPGRPRPGLRRPRRGGADRARRRPRVRLDGARSGFGLDGVQARAAEVGGAVQVLSEPGAGTTLRLVVPR